MGRRILNDALRTIVNAEKRGKASVELKPVSTVMSSFLKIMKEKGHIFYFCLLLVQLGLNSFPKFVIYLFRFISFVDIGFSHICLW